MAECLLLLSLSRAVNTMGYQELRAKQQEAILELMRVWDVFVFYIPVVASLSVILFLSRTFYAVHSKIRPVAISLMFLKHICMACRENYVVGLMPPNDRIIVVKFQ